VIEWQNTLQEALALAADTGRRKYSEVLCLWACGFAA
jgi:hypothetical protein